MKEETKKDREDSIEVSFSHYYDSSDVKEFDGLRLGKYTLKATKLTKPIEGSGGLIWYGIIIFLGSKVAEGFLQEIGKNIYSKIKNKLFKKKQKLEKANAERFTINIQCNQSMVFADFTNLSETEFNEALNKLPKVFKGHRKTFESNSKWYDLTFNRELKTWEIEENKSV